MTPFVDVARMDASSSATITLNRPEKRNALPIQLREDVVDALAELGGNEQVKSVMITGAGDVFSAGFDLPEFTRAAEDSAFDTVLWESSDRFHHALLTFPLPLNAEEARLLHVVNEVVPASALLARVDGITASIAAAPRANLLRTKTKVIARAGITLGPTLDL